MPVNMVVQITGGQAFLTQNTGTLTVTAQLSGSGPFAYAWYLNGAPRTETTPSFPIDSAWPLGSYRLSCLVRDTASSYAYSSYMDFSILSSGGTPPPAASASLGLNLRLPGNNAVSLAGAGIRLTRNVDYTVSASLSGPSLPPGPYAYEWFLNGTALTPTGTPDRITVGLTGPAGFPFPLPLGNYELSCLLSAGGYSYSQSLFFYVVGP
jgi:hypothetical protein